MRFFIDLDQDGLPDLFVGAKALLGPGDGPFRVYRRSGVGWLPIGEVFVHPGAIELLPSRHAGFVDLRYCGQVSVDACSLVTYVFGETAYGPSASPRVVSEGDLGARAFARTESEESGPRLTWR